MSSVFYGCPRPLPSQWGVLQRHILGTAYGMSRDAASVTCAAPKTAFTVTHTDGAARAGLLAARQGPLETPAPILYTFRGLPYSMTPDLLEALGPAAHTLHVDAGQLYEFPVTIPFGTLFQRLEHYTSGPLTLTSSVLTWRCKGSLDHPPPGLIRQHGGGAHGFFGLPACTLIASPRDPIQYTVQRWKSPSSDGVRVVTHSGHQDLSLDRWAAHSSGVTCMLLHLSMALVGSILTA